ncbi:uncharacterized protein LOC107812330 [Nicotiana tabacum]|uniref:Uncharacterized protein LOC107812330 n=2 Tax=Nicotiana TaxID=4085 RepID=A0A1S4BVH9_TOBAC|nr:PREDICTED: uncharacterized protein LOC104247358 [Nicotiana sylvestris]XP_016492875.1 PREDICTED: uncharacterized protein LOC107812330 [Nicotiana tabacum]
MAFRMRYWKSVVNAVEANRSFPSSTAPKFATATSGGSMHNANPTPPKSKFSMSGDLAPVYVLGGTLSVAIALCLFTMKQQLFHGPGVYISKKKRENLAEVDFPDATAGSANKYIDKSVLRKVGRIQEPNPAFDLDPYTRPRKVESLKSVGA